MAAPVIIKPVPAQVVNEGAAYGPIQFKDFINTPDNSAIRFQAELSSGRSLPNGMICTEDGIFTGIPGRDTHGNYEVNLSAENEEGTVTTTFILTIKPGLTADTSAYTEQLKTQIWQALDQNLPIPDLGELLNRPITPFEIYYLLERWATLTIWDAFNLDSPGEKHLLVLEGASPHYNVYDRGSCLVASPKDLFSHERTLEDALQTARALAREVYKRSWTVELAGFDKMTRAAWIEIQHLGDQYGKQLEVINFSASPDDVKIYSFQALERNTPSME